MTGVHWLPVNISLSRQRPCRYIVQEQFAIILNYPEFADSPVQGKVVPRRDGLFGCLKGSTGVSLGNMAIGQELEVDFAWYVLWAYYIGVARLCAKNGGYWLWPSLLFWVLSSFALLSICAIVYFSHIQHTYWLSAARNSNQPVINKKSKYLLHSIIAYLR
jgi:hypothetical protein